MSSGLEEPTFEFRTRLERELAEARAEIERLRAELNVEHQAHCGLRKEAEAEIERLKGHMRDCQSALDEATRKLRGDTATQLAEALKNWHKRFGCSGEGCLACNALRAYDQGANYPGVGE